MPLEVIESTDPLSNLITFQISPVYEMIISLQTLLRPSRHTAWVSTMRASLPADFQDELAAIYEPYMKGSLFFELAVDYGDHEDVPGFIDYVHHMDPVDFLFYLVGRVLTPEEIAQTGLQHQALMDAMKTSPYDVECFCTKVPFERITADVPAFQHRLADFWQWYWDEFFNAQIADIRPRWENGLTDKQRILAREGGQHLWEHVSGKPQLLPALPPEYPVTEIVFIPLYLISSTVYMFYGYGNITVLFDCERTEARIAEIERNKETAINVLKALGDNSRLDILRLIAHHEGEIHGKKIAHALNLSASAISRHLGQLKDAGVITEETQDNRTITYRMQSEMITALPDMLMDFLYR